LKSALRHAGETLAATHEEIAKQPAAVKMVQLDVTKITAHLADYERVRRVALLPNEFSIDNGEMTPTLKVKRNVIDDRYADLIEQLYGGA
jgi:long-chain acyl-CoA synthetase